MIIRPLKFAIVIAAVGLAASCGLASQAQRPEVIQGAYVVEVIAEDYAYSAPDSISSGWVTFRMRNEGEKHHFALLTRLPEGKTLDDYMVDVAQPFDGVMVAMRAGEMTKAEAGQVLGRSIPRWFQSAQRIGGPALLAPGRVSEVTLHLEPGEYFMECYMKTPEGEFHGMEGMVRPFTVTNTPSGASRPEADVAIRLTNGGIEAPTVMAPGRHTVAVHFAEQPETGGPHDVHLARLDAAAEIAEVVPWMDWMSVQGLRNPAPVDFFGGTHEMPAGATVYVTVDLEPGRYAWISQMTAAQGVLHEYMVQ
jgi:hypothetical protein